FSMLSSGCKFISNSIMHSASSALPKLYTFRKQTKSSPLFWSWKHFHSFKFLLHLLYSIIQKLTIWHHLTLRRGPSSYLATSRTRLEISGRLFWSNAFNFAFYANLTLQFRPKKQQ